MTKPEFRFADRKDSELILKFIKDLAEYEKMSDLVVATKEQLEEEIFGKKRAEVLFVMEDGLEVGFALFFHNFSTFLGRAGIYLEDLYVKPEYAAGDVALFDYSLFFVSMNIVTGPSFISSTFMSAPNSPV